MSEKTSDPESIARLRNMLPDILFISMVLISVVGLVYTFLQQ